MSFSNTTLSASIGPSDLTWTVGSTTGFPAVGVIGSRQLLRIDEEYCLVDQVPVSGQVRVLLRGYGGSVAASHDKLSQISTSSTASDWIQTGPPYSLITYPMWKPAVFTIGEDTTFTATGTAVITSTSPITIPIPERDTTYFVNKASAAAIILISGTAANAGTILTFVSQVAAAHTITYTPGFLGDTTASDVATSASKVGAVFQTICGPTGLWGTIQTSTSVSNWTVG